MSSISTTSAKQQRANDIVRRIDAGHGNSLDAARIAKDHPELVAEISHAVRRWNMVSRARERTSTDGSATSSRSGECGTDALLSSSPHPSPSQTGSFGPFLLIERLGSGSFGTVWRANDTRVNEEVALKLAHADSPTLRQLKRLEREAETNSRLTHPNIIPVHEVGQVDGRFYIVSRLLEGETLAQYLYRERPQISRAVEIASVLARALDHAPGLGVIHRDIKPANILIDEDGNPHIGDFGLAKADDSAGQLTREGDVFGTPTYMSPEQAAGDNQRVTGRSDVYSLGVVLYRMLTGELPFRGHHAMLRYQVLYDPPPSPRKFSPRITSNLETICLKCLEKRPHDRYQTAGDLANDLDRFLARKPITAKPRGVGYRIQNWVRRKPWFAAATAWLVCMVAILGIVAVRENKIRKDAQSSHANALLAVAETVRASKHPGHQWQVLESLDRAEELLDADTRVTNDRRIRRNKIAAYASPDWHIERTIELGDRLREQVVFDQDLRRFAYMNRDGNVVVGEPTTDHVSPAHIELPTKCFVTPTQLAIDPTGNFVAIGNDRALSVWSVETQQRVWKAAHPGRHNWCFHETNFYNSSRDEVVVFGLNDRKPKSHPIRHLRGRTIDRGSSREPKPVRALMGDGVALAVTRVDDQIHLAISSPDEGLAIGRLKDEVVPRKMPFADPPVTLQFSANGKHLAGGYRQGEIELWTNPISPNPRNRRRITIPAHRAHVVSIRFHPSRRYFVSNSIDGSSRLWDYSGSELMQAEEWVDRFDVTGERIAVYDRSRVGLAKFLDSPIREVLETDGGREFAICANGRLMVCKTKGRLWLREIATNAVCDWIPAQGPTKHLHSLATNGRNYVIAAGPSGISRVEIDLGKERFVDTGELWREFPRDGIRIDVAATGEVLVGQRSSGELSIIHPDGDQRDYWASSSRRESCNQFKWAGCCELRAGRNQGLGRRRTQQSECCE